MKTYIYTSSPRGKGIEVRIYRVKNNIPRFLVTASYSPASTKGPESVVFNKLMDIGEIPKKLYNTSLCEWRGPGYYCPEIEDKGYKIIGL